MDIQLFGADSCHKTQYYSLFLKTHNLHYEFLDIENSAESATKLSNLYENRNLNFPTIIIDHKRLRNPSEKELQKWIDKATARSY
jgi:arsenate reductase-like glutaredoxin family protein